MAKSKWVAFLESKALEAELRGSSVRHLFHGATDRISFDEMSTRIGNPAIARRIAEALLAGENPCPYTNSLQVYPESFELENSERLLVQLSQ